MEKPVLPAEPPEPILHGSMAIGAVSLAVIKASAHLTSTPLYMSITSLKHGQVSEGCIPSLAAWSLEGGGASLTAILMLPCFPGVSGAALELLYAFADGICTQLWEVIAWEAKSHERSDVHTPSRINSQTSTRDQLRQFSYPPTPQYLPPLVKFGVDQGKAHQIYETVF